MSAVIAEHEFAAALRSRLAIEPRPRSVTGPGRSGAVASVYASHLLGVPFIPFGAPCPPHLRPLLVVDTAEQSGRTLRKAVRKYEAGGDVRGVAVYREPPRVRFWYEASVDNRLFVT